MQVILRVQRPPRRVSCDSIGQITPTFEEVPGNLEYSSDIEKFTFNNIILKNFYEPISIIGIKRGEADNFIKPDLFVNQNF